MSKHANKLGMIACLAAALAPVGVLAEAKAPAPKDGDIARIVCSLMEKGHVSQRKLDVTISRRLHKSFLRLFDPLKLYFLESDANEFANSENLHQEETLKGDLHFAFQVYQRFLQRLDERVKWTNELLEKEKFDFDKEESFVVDPETAVYCKTEDEAKQRWKTRIKYELVTFIVDGKTEAEARERIKKRYRNISKSWKQMDGDELLELFLTSVTNSFDPHSTYMSARTLDDFNISIQLSLEGIGALLQSEDGITTVKEIVPGGAADKDGRLKPGDKIVGVGEGPDGEILDIVDMKLRDVVKHIRGKAGTIVRLEITPATADKRVVYSLTRQKIELKDGEAKGDVIEIPNPTGVGAPLKVGVIRLPSFYADSEAMRAGDAEAKTATNDVRRILEKFNQEGVAGVVMDLRSNGGGLLNEAIDLTGLFIDDGPIVQVRDYSGRVSRYMDELPGAVYRGPLIVLVNKFSASASEIFAGAIQDYGRGVIVGDSSTHGKGSVQKVYDLRRAAGDRMPADVKPGAVKLTTQKFYRVNGQSTQNRGVVSDVVIPSRSDHEDFGEAKLDYALDFDQIVEAAHLPMELVDANLIGRLKQAALDRQKTDPELQKLAQQKAKIHERRGRKVLTFTQLSLKKEREDLGKEDEEGEDDDIPSSKTKKKDKKFGTDPYTAEVLRIMGDYLKLKPGALTQR